MDYISFIILLYKNMESYRVKLKIKLINLCVVKIKEEKMEVKLFSKKIPGVFIIPS
jgi:hypothetical protein